MKNDGLGGHGVRIGVNSGIMIVLIFSAGGFRSIHPSPLLFLHSFAGTTCFRFFSLGCFFFALLTWVQLGWGNAYFHD